MFHPYLLCSFRLNCFLSLATTVVGAVAALSSSFSTYHKYVLDWPWDIAALVPSRQRLCIYMGAEMNFGFRVKWLKQFNCANG